MWKGRSRRQVCIPAESLRSRPGCSSRACSTPPARRRSVSGTAGRGGGLGPACGRGSGEEVVRGEGRPVDVRGRLRLVPWRPRRKGSMVPPVPQAAARSAGVGACGDTGTRRLCWPWKASAARWTAPAAQAVPGSGRTAPGGHACCQRPRLLPGRGRRRGAFRTVRGRDGALRIGSATRARKSSTVSRAG